MWYKDKKQSQRGESSIYNMTSVYKSPRDQLRRDAWALLNTLYANQDRSTLPTTKLTTVLAKSGIHLDDAGSKANTMLRRKLVHLWKAGKSLC